MRSDPAYITAVLDSIDRDYGSVENYVHDALGISEDQMVIIRRQLLAP
ncbi:MAG: tyrosine-protein phosphatase [Hyphomonas oceanitis]